MTLIKIYILTENSLAPNHPDVAVILENLAAWRKNKSNHINLTTLVDTFDPGYRL
ncbi:MAG: hypothetical protein ABIE07_01220 [Candidatus Zixiibacteriota bacterium]